METIKLNDFLNLSLETLITKNRDRYGFAMAADTDLAKIKSIDQMPRPVKETLEDWALVRFSDAQEGYVELLLVGTSTRTGHVWCTSPVILQGKGFVVTMNQSVYRLKGDPVEEVPLGHLWLLSKTMMAWGRGRLLGLPSFVY